MSVTSPTGLHPLHNLLAAFPVALFPAAFVTDLAYVATNNLQWANFSSWLIAGGLLFGVLAAIAGIGDYLVTRRRAPRPDRRSSLHTGLTLVALALALVNAFVHSRDGYTGVVPSGIVLSAVVAVLILIASWLGAALLYRPQPVGAA